MELVNFDNMGKKRVIKKTEEETLKNVENIKPVQKRGTIESVANKKFYRGKAYIQASYNNTIITLTDEWGNVISWTSAGSAGFKGSRKATPFAASRVAEILAEKVKKTGIQDLDVLVRGIGSGRDSAIRSLASHGFNILSIEDVTPLPHNGCRPRKARRV